MGVVIPHRAGWELRRGVSEVPGSQENWVVVLDLEDTCSGDVDAAKCASLQQLVLSKSRYVFAC